MFMLPTRTDDQIYMYNRYVGMFNDVTVTVTVTVIQLFHQVGFLLVEVFVLTEKGTVVW